jgi:hypothetical protein
MLPFRLELRDLSLGGVALKTSHARSSNAKTAPCRAMWRCNLAAPARCDSICKSSRHVN